MASMRSDAALRQIDRLFGEGTLAGLSDIRLLERYIGHRDELAFEALVRRHGSMVLGVCRRALDDPNDADDAFQAAFLLMARKARSIRADGTLGGWLHRVAWRIALQLRSDAARRRDQERRAAERAGEPITFGPVRDDTLAVIHQEIDRLPDRYRRPVVLCYLEDLSYQQAADQLRWSEATTRGRLARARDLLRARLTRRGVTLAGAGLSLAAGTSPSMASAVPAGLLRATVRAARHVGLGESAAVGTVSTTTIALMKQAARTMMIARLKATAAAALAIATLAGVATGLAATGAGGDGARPAGSRPIVKAGPVPRDDAGREKVGEGEMIALRGRVLVPHGKPAVGSGIYTIAPRSQGDWAEPVLRARTAGDGSFRFTLDRTAIDDDITDQAWSTLTVVAVGDGLGPDWVALKSPTDEPINLRLVDDSVPISGRILDLQGRPVVGARVTRGRIYAEGAEGIGPYLKRLREGPRAASNHHFARHYWEDMRLPGQPASVETDGEGRFRLTGIGRDRIVDIDVEGPTIQSATITAITRDMTAISPPIDASAARTLYGATFDHLITPGRALTGVVRDQRTRRPLAGVSVAGMETNARATTDAQGRYTLPGFPKGRSYGLMVAGDDKPPYFGTGFKVPDAVGLDPLRADVECVPGIPMRLKLIDKETGRPPRRADISYWPLHPNPHVGEAPGFAPVGASRIYSRGIRQDDGTYLLGVLPGPGAVVVGRGRDQYRPACVDPKTFFHVNEAKETEQAWLYGNRTSLFITDGDDSVGGLPQEQYGAIVLVNPPDDSGPITAEAVLERDRRREVRVLGPDGEPLAGVTAEGEGAEATKTPGVMTISRLNPMRPKRFTFRHDGRKLVGFLLARGDEPEPYTVKFQPWVTMIGRLVDAQGKPRPKAELMSTDWQDAHDDPSRGILPHVETDGEGRFRVEGLVPGQSYTGNAVGEEAEQRGFGVVIDRVVLKPGETRDLGDVRARPAGPKGDD